MKHQTRQAKEKMNQKSFIQLQKDERQKIHSVSKSFIDILI